MSDNYTGLITQNCAPPGVTRIIVSDDTGEVKAIMGVPQHMRYPHGQKIGTVGILSDSHMLPSGSQNNKCSLKLDRSLSFFEEQGVEIVLHCGDVTNAGLYSSGGEVFLGQIDEFARVRDLHSLPVYPICGNHESYNGAITGVLDTWRQRTGHGLYYTVGYAGDLYIFVGQPAQNPAMSEEELAWLEGLLAKHKNTRCVVVIHPYISGDSGNTNDIYGNPLLPQSSNTTKRLIAALSNHGRAMLLHGHSHFVYKLQELDKRTNYTDINGFPSAHVSSLSEPAVVENGSRKKLYDQSYGTVMDVFADCLVLRGVSFGKVDGTTMTEPLWSPHGSIKVDLPQGAPVYSVETIPYYCSTSNTDATITPGAAYSATITPADGCEVEEITVIMGGEDISSTAVSGRSISVPSVTGNLYITATATAVYTVVTVPTNCTNTNTAETVISGASYHTTIKADEGYELTAITVTMGGVDITEQAVNGAEISISSVTGDIIITATATAKTPQPSYINLIKTSVDADGNPYNGGQGWKDGYRLSGSSGGESKQSGVQVTGFMPVTGGGKVYMQGIRVPATASYGYLIAYNASKAMINKVYIATALEQVSANGYVTLDGSLVSGAQNAVYIRMSGLIDDNSVVSTTPIE